MEGGYHRSDKAWELPKCIQLDTVWHRILRGLMTWPRWSSLTFLWLQWHCCYPCSCYNCLLCRKIQGSPPPPLGVLKWLERIPQDTVEGIHCVLMRNNHKHLESTKRQFCLPKWWIWWMTIAYRLVLQLFHVQWSWHSLSWWGKKRAKSFHCGCFFHNRI